VEDYSIRFWSRASDRLPVLAGLAQQHRSLNGFQDQYPARLWEHHLSGNLLWWSTLYNKLRAEERLDHDTSADTERPLGLGHP
jgi:hypothetical protein